VATRGDIPHDGGLDALSVEDCGDSRKPRRKQFIFAIENCGGMM
jgi:hypothetical protein